MIGETSNGGEEIRVVLQTSRHRIIGTVHTLASAYHSRLSDLLNQEGLNFLSVADAEVYRDDQDEPELSCPYIAVRLASIETIRPAK